MSQGGSYYHFFIFLGVKFNTLYQAMQVGRCVRNYISENKLLSVDPKHTSISGLEWVVQDVQSTGKAAVASVSLGGSPSDTLDEVVNAVSGCPPFTPGNLRPLVLQLVAIFKIHGVV